MQNTINHFMWGYQQHFRVMLEGHAKETFSKLDDKCESEVFLVGIKHEDREDRHLACVEPEVDIWVASEDFDNALIDSSTILKTFPEANLLHSRPVAQQNYDDILFRSSVRDSIIQIINQHPKKPESIEYFVSTPVSVEGFWVSVCLGLPKAIIVAHRHLIIDKIPFHEYRDFSVSRSLIDSVISEYFAHASDQLSKPEPGKYSIGRDVDELMRAAGRSFASDLAYRADPTAYGWHSFFNSCNTIAALKYEKSASKGRIFLAKREHPSLSETIAFASEVDLSQFRGARKLLELSSRGLALHTNSKKVFGLVDCTTYSGENEDLFEVSFLDHHYWELSHAGKPLMHVLYGQPYFPKQCRYKSKLYEDLPRIFKEISEDEIKLLISLIEIAEQENHGTMLVISTAAKTEAQRLQAQSTAIKPQPLTPDLLNHLTSIDGAVLLNPKGICYAIGVILDGIASIAGTSARGARYNSALRYVSTTDFPCIAVVVSEDGGIDIIPELRPLVKRVQIDESLTELVETSKSSKVSRRRYSITMEWLEKHRFYMLEQDCNLINKTMEVIENRLAKDDPSAVRLVRSQFNPDSAMDADFYYTIESTGEEKGT